MNNKLCPFCKEGNKVFQSKTLNWTCDSCQLKGMDDNKRANKFNNAEELAEKLLHIWPEPFYENDSSSQRAIRRHIQKKDIISILSSFAPNQLSQDDLMVLIDKVMRPQIYATSTNDAPKDIPQNVALKESQSLSKSGVQKTTTGQVFQKTDSDFVNWLADRQDRRHSYKLEVKKKEPFTKIMPATNEALKKNNKYPAKRFVWEVCYKGLKTTDNSRTYFVVTKAYNIQQAHQALKDHGLPQQNAILKMVGRTFI